MPHPRNRWQERRFSRLVTTSFVTRDRYLFEVKYSELINACSSQEGAALLLLARACPLQEARELVGGNSKLIKMRIAGWLMPTVEVKRKTELNLSEALQAYARMTREGYAALVKAEA